MKGKCDMAGKTVKEGGVEYACRVCSGEIVVEKGQIGERHYLLKKDLLSLPETPDLKCPYTWEDPFTSEHVEVVEG